MKKGLAWFIALVLAAGLLSGCSSQEAEESSTENGAESEAQNAAEDITSFTVGFDIDARPYAYCNEDGEYVGFDLDLAAEVCKRNGWELVLRPVEPEEWDTMLSSGAVDCIWSGFAVNGREDEYTWTEPYADNRQAIIVTVESGIVSREELADMTAAVCGGLPAAADWETEEEETEEEEADAFFGQLIGYEDIDAAFEDLEAGAVDAVIADPDTARSEIAGREDGIFLLLEGEENMIITRQYAVAFLLGNEDLRDMVQAALDEMAADAALRKLARRWNMDEQLCMGK